MAYALVSTTGSGTVTIAANSRNVTGSGAAFTSALIGRIFFVGSQWGIVASVTDTATLTLDRPFLTGVSGAAWGHAATNANITQSGTDASLAALAAVPGVLSSTRGVGNAAKAFYDIAGLCLNITGTQTLDGDVECLIGTAVAAPGFNLVNATLSRLMVTVSSGGVFNYGRTTTVNGVVRYSTGLGIVSTGVSNDPFTNAWLEVKSGAVMNWRGGLIEKAACEYVRSGATFAVFNGLLYNKGTSDLQLRVEAFDSTASALVSINGLTLGGITNACRMWTAFGYASISLIPNFTNYQFNAAGSLAQSDAAVFTNFRNANNAAAADIIFNSNAATNIYRTLFVGYERQLVAAQQVVGTSGGIVAARRNITVTAQNAAKVAVQGAVVYAKEIDNGFRTVINTIDTLPTVTTVGSTNASGQFSFSPTVENIWCAFGTSTIRRDYRYNTDQSMNISVLAYGFNYWQASEAYVGINTLDATYALIADTSVTLSETAAGALTEIATFDNLYDAAKFWKTRAVAAQLEYPSISTQPVTANGTVLDLGSRNLVIDATAASAFAINTGTNTITIKSTTLIAGTKFRSLTTTGTVTFANGAVLNAPYTSSAGTNTVLTVTLNQSGARLRLTDNTNTERFNGIIAGTSQTFYFPPGSTGAWNGAVELYGYGRQTFSVTVTGGGIFTASVVLIPDTTIVANFATVSAYTAVDTSQEVRDWIAFYNQTATGIAAPVTAILTASSLNIGSATLAQGGALGFAGGVLTTGAATLSGVSIVTTGTQNAANLPTLTYPQQFTDSVGSTNWLNVTLTSGQVAQDSFNNSFQTASYTTFLPATYTSATTLTVTARGFKKQQLNIPYSAALLATQSVTLIPDTAVVDTTTNFLTPATNLVDDQEMYDAYSQWQATAVGILDTYLPTKSPGALDFGSVAATFSPSATDTITRGSGTITFKAVNVIAGTYYSTGTITFTGVTLATGVQIRASNLDSEIYLVNIDQAVLFPTEADRDANTNAGPTLTGAVYRYKYGATVSGVTLAGIIQARLTSSGIVFLVAYAVAPGSTTWSLDNSALLTSIAAKVDEMPTDVWHYSTRTLNGALFT